MSERPNPRLLTVPSEEHMFSLLTALNVSGVHPELGCDLGGGAGACIATLTDPDADYVNYVRADETGHSRCETGCENCGSDGPDDWKPYYPVTVILSTEPDTARAREDEIDVWWIAPARPTPPPAVCADPACTTGIPDARPARLPRRHTTPSHDQPEGELPGAEGK